MRNGTVRPLAEDLREMGLEPDRALAEIRKTASLVEARTGGGSHAIAPIGRNMSIAENDGGDGGQLDEAAFKIVKKLFKTAGEKVKQKLSRKKRGLAKLARMSRMYRKKNKRKIAKRMAKKLKKFGAKGLARLHKMRKRITMSAPGSALPALRESLGGSQLAQLREDIVSLGNKSKGNDASNRYEEAAFNAGVLAHYLGEVFDVCGDEAAAEAMYSLSDSAAELSEMLDGFGEGDDLSEDQTLRLRKILEMLEKGLKMHEEMGSPLVGQAMEFRLKHDTAAFIAECGDEEEDEDDDEEDEDDEDDEDEDDDD